MEIPGSREEGMSTVSTDQVPNISEAVQPARSPALTATPTYLPSPLLATPKRPRKLSAVVAPEVQWVGINNGNFTFLDHAGGMLASVRGVNFRTSIRSALALRGDGRVAKISLRARFFLEQFH